MHTDPTAQAFLDELQKISAAYGRMTVPSSRSGRRSMRVATLLAKDAAGTLWRKHAVAGGWQETPFTTGPSPEASAARKSRTKSEVLSEVPSREDGREMATMVPAVNVPVGEIAVTTPSTGIFADR